MKSLKKTLVLLVVFSMILSAVMPAFAATDVAGLDCEEEVARLEALKIVSGYEDGTYGPENTIKRSEMAVILCKMVGIDEVTVEENKYVPSKFSDVAVGEWYTGHINVAAGKGLLSGFPDGTFRPDEALTMNQVLTLCVNALGRGEYVAEMGTWPANYIAEATKLGLLDGVKTSDANRGNVAIIAWNTLEAPYVWDVNSTEFEGTINLSNSKRSLLSIYFRDFATEAGELKEIAELTEFTIDERQLKIAAADVEFADEFEKEPKKGLKEKSYKVLAKQAVEGVYPIDYVRVYVPEEVCEDLDELENKEITIILGKDEVAVAIIIEDEAVEKDFLTAFESENGKEKVTIGGTKYKMDTTDDRYEVVLNGKKYKAATQTADQIGYANLTEALVALGVLGEDETSVKDIEKKVKAEIKLNDDEEVEFIELTASAYIPTISDEVLVTKVKETNSKYTITTTKGKITWDIEAENDGDVEFPKVYVDGVKADIRDIVPGMVISIFGRDLDSDSQGNLTLVDTKELANIKIHVVANGSVEGEASRIKKANLAITMDGTVYTPSNANVTMSTEELAKYNDADKTVESDKDAIVDNDTVTLYLNMFGEYAFVTLDEVASNWTFGVITYVSSNITFEGEDEEIAVRNIKLLLADGSKKTFKLKADTEDEDTKANSYLVAGESGRTYTTLREGWFVAVDADADRVITIEDGNEVIIIDENGDKVALKPSAAAKLGDYVIRVVGGDEKPVDKDDEEFDNGKYEYTSKTVIFNKELKEIVAKWKAILNDDGNRFEDEATIAVFEDDEADEALYIVVALGEEAYGNEDAVYAIVEESENLGGNENYVKFVGQEEMEAKDINLLDEGWLVAYRVASSKVSEVQKLIDVENIVDAADADKVFKYLFADYVAPVHVAQLTCTTNGCENVNHEGHDDDAATEWKVTEKGVCAKHEVGDVIDTDPASAGTLDCGCTYEATAWDITTTTCSASTHNSETGVTTKPGDSSPLACDCTFAESKWVIKTVAACKDATHVVNKKITTEVDDQVCTCTAVPSKWPSCTKKAIICSEACDCDTTNECGGTAAKNEVFVFDLDSNEKVSETRFINIIESTTKMEQIVLEEVEIKTSGKITLKYEKTGDPEASIGSVKLDKDIVKVYDLRDGEVKVTDIDALAEEVNVDGEDVYVITAVNGDYDKDGANVVFIVK